MVIKINVINHHIYQIYLKNKIQQIIILKKNLSKINLIYLKILSIFHIIQEI
jgi:hypothetical protein